MKNSYTLRIVLLAILPALGLRANDGHFLTGIGPVNEALGGAAAAGNIQDLAGSLSRNPANGVLFDGMSASLDLGLLLPHVTASSSVGALGLNGSSESSIRAVPAGSLTFFRRPTGSRVSFHAMVLGEAGLALKFDQSVANPILTPQAGAPNNPFGGLFGGFGTVTARYNLIRMPIGLAFTNDRWAFGASLGPALSRLQFSPAAFTAPDDANSDRLASYPTVRGYDYRWGFGGQAGVRYKIDDRWAFGASYTSGISFKSFSWPVTDELGRSRTASFRLNRPHTVFAGLSYRPAKSTLLVSDVGWINYSHTTGFEKTGYTPTGALAGLGWRDVFVYSLGAQIDISPSFTVRLGYNYGQNPISVDRTFYNLATPLHSGQNLSAGFSVRLDRNFTLNAAFTHTFEHSQSTPFLTPFGPAPGTSLTTSTRIEMISLGLTWKK